MPSEKLTGAQVRVPVMTRGRLSRIQQEQLRKGWSLMTLAEWAAYLGRTEETIVRFAEREGLPFGGERLERSLRDRRPWTEADDDKLMRQWHRFPKKITARELGRSVQCCALRFRKLASERGQGWQPEGGA